jgi:PAS domain S-box-containing protein
MIWESTALMAIVDLAILLVAILALRNLYRHRRRFAHSGALRGLALMAIGLSAIGLFHLADLFTMFVLPQTSSPAAAMAAMENLHLNYSWPIILASVLCLSGGISVTSARLLSLVGDLTQSRSALADELARSEQTQASLRTSEERFRLMAGHIEEVFWLNDSARRIQYVSPAYETIWGRSVDSLRSSEDWLQTIHTDDRARVEEILKCAVDEGGYDVEYRIVRPDGGIRWVRDRGFAIPDESSATYRMVGITSDVTVMRQREAKLQQTQKLESLGVLAGGIAHDFNNLLTGILGRTSLLQKRLASDAQLRDAVDRIESAVLRATELTSQMLAYAGKSQAVVEQTDLSRLVGEMVPLLEVAISQSAPLKLELDPQVAVVDGDPAQLRQVVMNLITNASEAITDADGVITLHTGVVEADSRYLETVHTDAGLREGRYACVEVSDTGAGMTGETKAKVLEPFFTTKFTGRGLGLAAVFGIVRSHGGGIKIDSEPSRGSTFTILLPVAVTPARPDNVTVEGIEEWRGSGTGLVVDDEADIRQTATDMLESLGFQVRTASDGRRAVKVLREHPETIDFVLLDVTMPGLDGAATLRELRRIRADVPTILMSGYTQPGTTTRFDGEPLVGFVQKPFRLATLAQSVKRALDG